MSLSPFIHLYAQIVLLNISNYGKSTRHSVMSSGENHCSKFPIPQTEEQTEIVPPPDQTFAEFSH